jgi:hypothetical protein
MGAAYGSKTSFWRRAGNIVGDVGVGAVTVS